MTTAILNITIPAVILFDKECGGVMRLAQRLVENSVAAEEEKLLLRILKLDGESLLEVTAVILERLEKLGAITAQRQLDLKPLRMFFLGVLAWTPETLTCAGLEDLSDAYEGFARYNGIILPQLSTPTQNFLAEMMQRFPDI